MPRNAKINWHCGFTKNGTYRWKHIKAACTSACTADPLFRSGTARSHRAKLSLGSASFQMITNGESEIRRVIAVNWSGKVIPPCGACRELMAQLMPKSYQHIEIMLNYETRETALLGALTPKWWI